VWRKLYFHPAKVDWWSENFIFIQPKWIIGSKKSFSEFGGMILGIKNFGRNMWAINWGGKFARDIRLGDEAGILLSLPYLWPLKIIIKKIIIWDYNVVLSGCRTWGSPLSSTVCQAERRSRPTFLFAQ
jgi:hypothetical protein